MDQEFLLVFIYDARCAEVMHSPLGAQFTKMAANGEPLTCYKQFGKNSIFVLMFVESQRVHI